MKKICPFAFPFLFILFLHRADVASGADVPLLQAEQAGVDVTRILSPDSSIQFDAFIDNGRLMYSITFHHEPVIERSALGIILDNADLGQNVSSGGAEFHQTKLTYRSRGKHSTATNYFTSASIPLQNRHTHISYSLEVRVYNDGVAFRYVIPGKGKHTLNGEATTFSIPAGSTVWYHGVSAMHYEEKHKKRDVSLVEAGEWAGPPMTVKLPRETGYLSITESGIIRSSGENFPGMALEADGKRRFIARLGHEHPANYPFLLRYGEEYQKHLELPPVYEGGIEGPWRVVLIGKDLNALFNSDVVYNTAPPPDPKLFPHGADEEWMKPGRAVWGYLTDEPRTLEGMKNLSRLAEQLGFEYQVVEGHWARWTEAEQKELVDYSNEHHVKLLFWKHSKDLRDADKRDQFFRHLHDLGVAGAKIDFFDHEAKEIIDLYAACLREAARYKLIVDFHGANKPTGQDRTWPNEMAREGVFGMEFRGPWATHNTTLPFTRLLAGPMDYTVVAFGERRCETSETHQLASALVLQSPLLVFAEHPRNLLEHPAVEFIKQIPSVWDETIVLPASEIGEVSAFARRSGDKWFVSVMNGESPKSISIDLSFLGDGEYKAMMVQDKRPESATVSLIRSRKTFGGQQGVNILHATATKKESLFIQLISGGGFVAVFSK